MATGAGGERRPEVFLLEHRIAAVPVRLECAQLRDGSAGGRHCRVSPRPRTAGATARRRCCPGLPPSIAALVGDPNNTTVQIQGNIPGVDDREVTAVSGKIDWQTGIGTVTLGHRRSTSSIWSVPSRPSPTSRSCSRRRIRQRARGPTRSSCRRRCSGRWQTINATTGQNRFHDAWSQEVRLTSPDKQRLRWILGGYYVATDLDVMISVNRDLGGRGRRAADGPEHRRREPDGAVERAIRRGGGSGVHQPVRRQPGRGAGGVPVEPAAGRGLRGEPRQPEPESERAVVQLRSQRQQRVCGLRADELRPERARRIVVRAPLRPGRSDSSTS